MFIYSEEIFFHIKTINFSEQKQLICMTLTVSNEIYNLIY